VRASWERERIKGRCEPCRVAEQDSVVLAAREYNAILGHGGADAALAAKLMWGPSS